MQLEHLYQMQHHLTPKWSHMHPQVINSPLHCGLLPRLHLNLKQSCNSHSLESPALYPVHLLQTFLMMSHLFVFVQGVDDQLHHAINFSLECVFLCLVSQFFHFCYT